MTKEIYEIINEIRDMISNRSICICCTHTAECSFYKNYMDIYDTVSLRDCKNFKLSTEDPQLMIDLLSKLRIRNILDSPNK